MMRGAGDDPRSTDLDGETIVFGGNRAMEGRIARDAGIVRLALAGEFDLAAAADFDSTLADIEADRPQAIVIDLDGLTYMDSTGLGALMAAHGRAGGDHVIAVLAGTGPAHRLIALVGLDAHLTLVRDVSEIAGRTDVLAETS